MTTTKWGEFQKGIIPDYSGHSLLTQSPQERVDVFSPQGIIRGSSYGTVIWTSGWMKRRASSRKEVWYCRTSSSWTCRRNWIWNGLLISRVASTALKARLVTQAVVDCPIHATASG